MKPEYTPFEKDIDKLDGADLAVLREVSEGWYVEYKREPVAASAIAKSVAAFANTYGGWLFIGIEEASKSNPVAGAFVGFPASELEAVVQRVRQSVAHHLQPTPMFRTRAIEGPVPAIGLADGRAIVAVEVPYGMNAPYVHSDGRVYRRVADSSEPETERDRYAIDRLRKRSDPTRDFYRTWVGDDPVFASGESETPFLRILITPDLWFERDIRHELSLSAFKELLNKEGMLGSSIPFDTVYTDGRGYVARQTNNADPYFLGLTWRLSNDLVSDILIPLGSYKTSDVSHILLHLVGYQYAERFYEVVRVAGHQSPTIIDLSLLWNVLTGLCETLQRVMTAAGCDRTLHYKMRLLNIWRKIPFVDIERAIALMETHGVSMTLDESVTIPPGHEPESFLSNDFKPSLDDQQLAWIMLAFSMHLRVSSALGITGELAFPIEEGGYLTELRAAGERARNRHNNSQP